MNTIEQGFYLVAIMDGYLAEPWKNDASKVNHLLGVSKQFTNKFGQMESQTYSLNVASDAETLKHVQECAKKFEGKSVMVPVMCSAKESKTGSPWISYFVPKGSQIRLLEK